LKLAMVVPGGVDPSGEVKVIPALLALIARLAARHELHVVALYQQPEPGRWPLLGAQVHNVGAGPNALRQWRALRVLAREHARAPFDVIQSLWAGPCGMTATLAGRWLGVPVAVHVAGGELVALDDIAYGGRRDLRGRWREAWLLRQTQAVTAASQPMLDQIAALGCHAQRLPLGVDLARWPAQPPQRRAPGEPLRLIHVASLNRVKDPACLLHAVAQLRAQRLALRLDQVGVDTLDGEAQRLATRLGLDDCVHFHGFQTQAQLRPLLARAHLHLVSSRHEAGPVAALEAAVLGVPSVGTAVGHLQEWDAQAPAPGDAQGLAQRVAALAADEDARLALAAHVQRLALQEDADHTAARFEQLHATLCRAGR
jgi:glycosyltransferase involved in cell wall biosynthesis